MTILSKPAMTVALIMLVALLPAVAARDTDNCHEKILIEGVFYCVPMDMALGYYKAQGADELFAGYHVWFEPELLGEFDRRQIPVGEMSTLSLNVQDADQGRFLKSIGAAGETLAHPTLAVKKLPGYPGPYGDAAFYYQVWLPDGRVLEITAHRQRFSTSTPLEEPFQQTHYDQVIEETILPGLEVKVD